MKLPKTFLMFLCLLISFVHVVAQGTFTFTVTLTADQALPPNTRIWGGEGSFTLSQDSMFEGSVAILRDLGQGDVTIYASMSPQTLGTPVFTLVPGESWPPFLDENGEGDPGGRHFHAQRSLSPVEQVDLLAGHWWAVYTTPSFPDGELRGQVQIVPEPSTWVLLGLGAAVIWFLVRSTRLASLEFRAPTVAVSWRRVSTFNNSNRRADRSQKTNC